MTRVKSVQTLHGWSEQESELHTDVPDAVEIGRKLPIILTAAGTLYSLNPL